MSLFKFSERKVGTVFKADSRIGRRLTAQGKPLVTKATDSPSERESVGDLIGKQVTIDGVRGVVKWQGKGRVGVAIEGRDGLLFAEDNDIEM